MRDASIHSERPAAYNAGRMRTRRQKKAFPSIFASHDMTVRQSDPTSSTAGAEDQETRMTVSRDGKKGIVIICNLDTRGEDIVFVKDLIRGRGHDAILVDFSMEEPPPLAGDVTC